jgi:cobalamin biosynthesis Mg chelatase CobN
MPRKIVPNLIRVSPKRSPPEKILGEKMIRDLEKGTRYDYNDLKKHLEKINKDHPQVTMDRLLRVYDDYLQKLKQKNFLAMYERLENLAREEDDRLQRLVKSYIKKGLSEDEAILKAEKKLMKRSRSRSKSISRSSSKSKSKSRSRSKSKSRSRSKKSKSKSKSRSKKGSRKSKSPKKKYLKNCMKNTIPVIKSHAKNINISLSGIKRKQSMCNKIRIYETLYPTGGKPIILD